MENVKAITTGNLADIENKLERFGSLLSTLYEYGAAEYATISYKALGAMCDMLDSIRGDLRADIECLERIVEAGVTA